MDPRLADFVEATEEQHAGRLRRVDELLRRHRTDLADAAVIGGATLADIVGGQVTDADLEPEVLQAFHTAYPNLGSLVERVQALQHDPPAIAGLLSGIRGKLFELRYVRLLNDGQLPAGYQAVLADSPTQPGWDVAIEGPDGETVEQLQLKASAAAAYVRQAVTAHPDIPVVVPGDAYQQLSTHEALAGRVHDGGVELEDLHSALDQATAAAGAASAPDLVPELALALIAAQTVVSLLAGKRPRAEIARGTAIRISQAAAAGAVGGFLAWLAGPWVGVPASIATRLLLTRRVVQRTYEEHARARAERLKRIAESLGLREPG